MFNNALHYTVITAITLSFATNAQAMKMSKITRAINRTHSLKTDHIAHLKKELIRTKGTPETLQIKQSLTESLDCPIYQNQQLKTYKREHIATILALLPVTINSGLITSIFYDLENNVHMKNYLAEHHIASGITGLGTMCLLFAISLHIKQLIALGNMPLDKIFDADKEHLTKQKD